VWPEPGTGSPSLALKLLQSRPGRPKRARETRFHRQVWGKENGWQSEKVTRTETLLNVAPDSIEEMPIPKVGGSFLAVRWRSHFLSPNKLEPKAKNTQVVMWTQRLEES